ncbi:MAG TPA: hypothetical protein VGG48_01900 [Rhizomicrobium sp.]|jgi:hypothetical protein
MIRPRLVPLDDTLLRIAIALERDQLAARFTNLYERRALLAPDRSFAFVDGGELLGAGGLVPVWPGRAEGWLLVSRLARPRQVVAGVRAARAWLDRKLRDPDYARIEFYIRADAPWRESFARALGCAEQGAKLRRWGLDGADYVLHARISEEGMR